MNARRHLVIWGAKGHAKVLKEFMEPAGYDIVGLVDNDPNVVPPFEGPVLLMGLDGLKQFMESRSELTYGIVAVGGSWGRDRIRLQAAMTQVGLEIACALHPAAFIARDATIGVGTHVLAHASVCAEARIGNACILNTGCSVDHECRISDGVHIAPGAVLAGCVDIGEASFIGPGAVITAGVKVGSNTIVGAGAVVVGDLPDDVVAFGVPARVQRTNANPERPRTS